MLALWDLSPKHHNAKCAWSTFGHPKIGLHTFRWGPHTILHLEAVGAGSQVGSLPYNTVLQYLITVTRQEPAYGLNEQESFRAIPFMKFLSWSDYDLRFCNGERDTRRNQRRQYLEMAL